MIWLVQLVFDCHDPDVVGGFWGRLLRYDNDLVHATPDEVAAFRAANPQFDGRGRVDDRALRRTPIYLQRVPEAKADRNRVRLEVVVPEGDDELVVGDHIDPEGNEYAVVRGGSERCLSAIVIDAVDPERQAAFWSDATGYTLSGTRCEPPPSGLRWHGASFTHEALAGIELLHITAAGAPPGPARYDLTPALSFVAAPTAKQRKNRLHIDLSSDDALVERERLVALGAEVVQWDTDHVLVDPEGNEFCLGGRTRRAGDPSP